MISIIICSRNKNKDDTLVKNIEDTIGSIPYEIVWIDNSDNKYNIFQAYNEGVRLAKYEYLCFMHEDVVFHSLDWGITAVRQMEDDEEVGMLGVIGSKFVSKYSTSWFDLKTMYRGYIIQGYFSLGRWRYKTHILDYSEYKDKDVVTIDGLWMFIRRELFYEKVAWDSSSFSGFHFYDMDMSLQVKKAGYRIEIVPIHIEHKSQGNKNATYWDNYIIFHTKWNNDLPMGSPSVSMKDVEESDRQLLQMISEINKQNAELEKFKHTRFSYKLQTIKKIFKYYFWGSR